MLVALAVFVFGAVIVLVPSFKHTSEIWDRDPFSVRLVTTTVKKTTEPGTTTTPDLQKVTKTASTGKNGATRTTTVETTAGSTNAGPSSTETTTTTTEASDSLLERALSTGGLLLFRLAIVGFAAFIAGAVVQRAILGRFALKVGVLELGDITDVTAGQVAALQTAINGLASEHQKSNQLTGRQIQHLRVALKALSKQVDELGKRPPAPSSGS